VRPVRRHQVAEYAYIACAADSWLKKDGGDRFRIAAVPHCSPNWRLFLYRVVQFFSGIHHVLMRLLNGIELRLLIRRE